MEGVDGKTTQEYSTTSISISWLVRQCIAAGSLLPYYLPIMTNILNAIAAVLGALLALLILLQHRASGLSATFGGGGTAYVQRRGAEKVLFKLTIWISVAFFGIAIAMMYIG